MNSTSTVFDILKNAPIGVKLYCSISGEVTLSSIQHKEKQIIVETDKNEKITLNETGCLVIDKVTYGRCILFPSEEDTSWSNWQETLFEGDNIIVKNHNDEKLYLIQYDVTSWYAIDTENKISVIPRKDIKQYEFSTVDERKKFITEITNYYSKL